MAEWDGAQRLRDCGFWQSPAPTACCAALTLSSQGSFPKAPWWLAEISKKARNRVCVCTWEAGVRRVVREFASAVIFSLSDKTEKFANLFKRRQDCSSCEELNYSLKTFFLCVTFFNEQTAFIIRENKTIFI